MAEDCLMFGSSLMQSNLYAYVLMFNQTSIHFLFSSSHRCKQDIVHNVLTNICIAPPLNRNTKCNVDSFWIMFYHLLIVYQQKLIGSVGIPSLSLCMLVVWCCSASQQRIRFLFWLISDRIGLVINHNQWCKCRQN